MNFTFTRTYNDDNMQEIYSKQQNSGGSVSKKRINYCENVYESTSLSGISDWWLKIGFFRCDRQKVFQSTMILQKVF